MFTGCPGQDKRNLKAQVIDCPGCGCGVEIFSDEVRIICPKCKNLVYRDRLPSCIDWCKAAEMCVGKEKMRQPKTGNLGQNR